MSEDNFQYRPLSDNSSKRPKQRRFPNLKLPKFNFKSGGKWDFKKILLWTGVGFVGLFIAGVLAVTILIAVVSIGLPNIHDLDKLYVAQSTTIYDRENNVLYVKYGGENRKYVPYDQISHNIINATVAIEDDQFWEHSGFDLMGITRAFVNNVFGSGPKQGGSTLTQQYIKNAFLSSEKTYTRKLKELILAVQLEQAYSKEEILELYLNKIPYGNNSFGVEKASKVYFDKKAKDLDLAEAAVLASLPKAPSYYNPYGPRKYSELTVEFSKDEIKNRNIDSESDLKNEEFLRGLIGKTFQLDDTHSVYIQGRTDLVLKSMTKLGYLENDEKEEALEKLQNLEFKEYKERMVAPHFVFHVLGELEQKYGTEIVEQGGLQVYTTIDPTLQDYAETAIEEGVAKNKEKYNAKNGALTSIDPKTGQILAMVGSVDYFSEEIDGAVNMTTRYRQPGSSFKPIVYAKAFYNRYAPASIIFDVKTRFGSNHYPKNYDGLFMGPISIRKALAQSRNIPAIKTYYLADELEGVMDLSAKLGITFFKPERDFGWTIALGSAEVKQLELTSAFGAFANNGILHKPVSILKVENAKGEILEEWKETEGEEVLDPQVAYLITDILSDTSVNLGPLQTVPGHRVAAKTGTSTNDKDLPNDLWTIGYSPGLVTAVWAGNNKTNEGNYLGQMASGYTAATPIWSEFMRNALKDKPAEDFIFPEGIITAKVSKLTGKLPGPSTPDSHIIEELFTSFSVPTEVDNSYSTVKIDNRNNKLANEFCPEKFTEEKSFIELHALAPFPNWEEGVTLWLEEKAAEFFSDNAPEEGEDVKPQSFADVLIGIAPSITSELCTEKRLKDRPKVTIKSPKDSEEVEKGTTLMVEIKINAVNGTEKVEYYFDDNLKYTAHDSPYTGKIRLPKGETGTKPHIITVKVFDNFGYSSEKTVQIITTSDPKNKDKEDPDEPPTDPPPDNPTPPEPTPEEDLPPIAPEETPPIIEDPPTPELPPDEPTI